MKLKNCPFSEYLAMTQEQGYEYTYALKYGMYLNLPNNLFNIKPLTDCTFEQVKDLQMMIEAGIKTADMPKAIKLFIDRDIKDLYKSGIVEISKTFAWLMQEVQEITDAERIMLVRPSTDKEKRAGVERFEKYSVYPQFRAIALAFNTTIDQVKQMKYGDCFLELCYQRDLSDFQSDYLKQK